MPPGKCESPPPSSSSSSGGGANSLFSRKNPFARAQEGRVNLGATRTRRALMSRNRIKGYAAARPSPLQPLPSRSVSLLPFLSAPPPPSSGRSLCFRISPIADFTNFLVSPDFRYECTRVGMGANANARHFALCAAVRFLPAANYSCVHRVRFLPLPLPLPRSRHVQQNGRET